MNDSEVARLLPPKPNAKERRAWRDSVYRTTKAFAMPKKGAYPGCFPPGFIAWVRELGYFGDRRVYLCGGRAHEDDPHCVTVDVRHEVAPTLCEDARHTSLESASFDWAMIDPPYSAELAEQLYGTREHFGSVNEFAKEGARLVRGNGLLLTLSYEIPKRQPGFDFIAVCGIYQVPIQSRMRCFAVQRRKVHV